MSKAPILTETQEFISDLCDKYEKEYGYILELGNLVDIQIKSLKEMNDINKKYKLNKLNLEYNLYGERFGQDIYDYIESKLK